MSTDDPVGQTEVGAEDKLGANYGDEYSGWKDWDAETFGVLSKRDKADLSALIKKSKTILPPQSRVLEIGFGNGGFLAYGNKHLWEMHGMEVNDGLIKLALQKGFRAVHADNLKLFPDNYFNLVLAVDVLEHIPQDVMLDYLREIQRVMNDDGVFIARFPNGDSPFARMSQHGDPTHVTTIGSMKARYFVSRLGVKTIYIGGEPQPLLINLPHFVYRVFTVPVKMLINFILNLLFCPNNHKAFCSLNLVMIYRAVKTTSPLR